MSRQRVAAIVVKDNKVLLMHRVNDGREYYSFPSGGKDSVKINVHSTGYGLFIAKQIVDAHHGRIWADSESAGKGSTFFVEL